jgi:hypothetical protein
MAIEIFFHRLDDDFGLGLAQLPLGFLQSLHQFRRKRKPNFPLPRHTLRHTHLPRVEHWMARNIS